MARGPMSHDLGIKVQSNWGPQGVVPEGTKLNLSMIDYDCCKTLPFYLPEANCPIFTRLVGRLVADVTINFSSIKPSIKVWTKLITYFGDLVTPSVINFKICHFCCCLDKFAKKCVNFRPKWCQYIYLGEQFYIVREGSTTRATETLRKGGGEWGGGGGTPRCDNFFP